MEPGRSQQIHSKLGFSSWGSETWTHRTVQHGPDNPGFSSLLCLPFQALSPQSQERPLRVEEHWVNWESLLKADCAPDSAVPWQALFILSGAGEGCKLSIENGHCSWDLSGLFLRS